MPSKRKVPTVRLQRAQTKYRKKTPRLRINRFNSYISKTAHRRSIVNLPDSMTVETLLDTSGLALEGVEAITATTIGPIAVLKTDR